MISLFGKKRHGTLRYTTTSQGLQSLHELSNTACAHASVRVLADSLGLSWILQFAALGRSERLIGSFPRCFYFGVQRYKISFNLHWYLVYILPVISTFSNISSQKPPRASQRAEVCSDKKMSAVILNQTNIPETRHWISGMFMISGTVPEIKVDQRNRPAFWGGFILSYSRNLWLPLVM